MVQRFVAPYKLAHFLRKDGFSCQVIDYSSRMDGIQLYTAIRKFITPTTLMIGLSTSFIAMDSYRHSDGKKRSLPEHTLKVLRTIKAEFPKIEIVVGGYLSEKISDYGVFDTTIMRYGGASEDVLLEHVRWRKGFGDEPIGSMHKPGFGGRERMWYHTARKPSYSIETDDFRFIKQDCILPGEPLPLDTSRGCIFACRFCRFMHLGKKKLDYLRPMEYIKEELIHNRETFNTTNYYLLDDTFNDTQWKVGEFHKLTQELDFNISFAAYIRADLIQRFPDMGHQLQESGLVAAQHGIETLHPEDSKLIGKGWSGTHARTFIPTLYHDVWKGRVNQHMSFIVGFPNSTEKDIWETVDWFVDNKLDSAMFFPLSLFKPNETNIRSTTSEFDRNAEKYGYSWQPIDGRDGNPLEWKNKNWTESTATRVAIEARDRVRLYNRVNSWDAMPLRWYGMDPNDVLTTRYRDLDKEWFIRRGKELVAEYHSMLMAL
jgi:hypothetical protein